MQRFQPQMYLLLLCLTALLWSLTFYFACFIGYRILCRAKRGGDEKSHGNKAMYLLKTIASAKVIFAALTTIACWTPSTISCGDSEVSIAQQAHFVNLRARNPDRIIVILFLLLPALNAFLGVVCFSLSQKTALNDEKRAWPILSLLSMLETVFSLVMFFLTGFVYAFCLEFWRRVDGDCTVNQRPWMLAIYASYAAAISGIAITIVQGFLSYFVPGQKLIDELEAIGDAAEKAVSSHNFYLDCLDETHSGDEDCLPFSVAVSEQELLVTNTHHHEWISFKVVPIPSSALKASRQSSFVLSPGCVHPIKLTHRGNKTQRFSILWLPHERENSCDVWNHWNVAISSGFRYDMTKKEPQSGNLVIKADQRSWYIINGLGPQQDSNHWHPAR